MLAPEQVDYRDRWLYKKVSPVMRVARRRFWDDGILLPFGAQRSAFDTPNYIDLWLSKKVVMSGELSPVLLSIIFLFRFNY